MERKLKKRAVACPSDIIQVSGDHSDDAKDWAVRP
jgi:hypothetical protein